MKLSNLEISKAIFEEGKIIKCGAIPVMYSIVEAFGQTFRIENPGTKECKIYQLSLSKS